MPADEEYVRRFANYAAANIVPGKVRMELRNESWNVDAKGNWHFQLNGEEVPPPPGVVIE